MKYFTNENILTILLEGKIDSANAALFENEYKSIRAEHPDATIIMDMENLKYISSAGLRVLLKICKTEGKIELNNVTAAVYEVLEITGLNTLFSIHKAARRFSVEGLKKIGQGGTAAVYRLDEDKIIKVFVPRYPMSVIQLERQVAQRMFLEGLPTAVPYDVVKVGEKEVGVIYELLYADTMINLLVNDADNTADNIELMAALLKQNSTVELSDFNDYTQMNLRMLRMLVKAGIFTEAESDKYKKIYDNVPDRSTFLHGDFHPGNIMISSGEPMMIDLAAAAKGHPIFDLTGMCTYLEGFSTTLPKENYITFAEGLEPERARMLWTRFLHAYFNDKDEKFIEKANIQIKCLAYLRVLAGTIVNELFHAEEGAKMAKQFLEEHYDIAVSSIDF